MASNVKECSGEEVGAVSFDRLPVRPAIDGSARRERHMNCRASDMTIYGLNFDACTLMEQEIYGCFYPLKAKDAHS